MRTATESLDDLDPSDWAKHDRSHWRRLSANTDLKLWLRIVAYCYGNHRRDGHTPLAPDELADNLLTADGKPQKRQNIDRAVGVAVDHGMLDARSWRRCVVAPKGIRGGLGSRGRNCQHHGPRTGPKPRANASQTDASIVGISRERASETDAPMHRELMQFGASDVREPSLITLPDPSQPVTDGFVPWDHEPSPFLPADLEGVHE